MIATRIGKVILTRLRDEDNIITGPSIPSIRIFSETFGSFYPI